MSYQFLRIELFSRKGKNGRNTDFILDEVSRQPNACLHVLKPEEPTIVFGEDVSQLRVLHDERANSARTVTAKGKTRKIRNDQNTLVGIVLSHPATIDDYRNNIEVKCDVAAWEKRSIDWLRAQYGTQLKTVVRHTDESHPHLHAYIISDDPEMKAANLHPGFTAKNEVMGSSRISGEDSKTQKKRADRAYVDAMRAWLDSYSKNVAILSGQTRLGPGKRRLTRAEWQREKVQASALRETVKRAKTVRAETIKMTHRAQQAAHLAELKTKEAEKRQRQSMLNARLIAEARNKAVQELQATEESTRRLQGVGGQIRAAIDGFQTSKIARSIANDFHMTIQSLRTALKQAQQQLSDERKRRRETEEKLATTSASLQELAIARNSATKQLRVLQEKNNPEPLEHVGYQLNKKEMRP